jgi:hypothetical protein
MNDVVELADRRSETCDVTLFWSRRSGRVWVRVIDRLSGRSSRIDASPADAMEVFRHPFAYEPLAA